MELHTIGIDLAKTVFHLVGLNLRGEVVVRKRFSRKVQKPETGGRSEAPAIFDRGFGYNSPARVIHAVYNIRRGCRYDQLRRSIWKGSRLTKQRKSRKTNRTLRSPQAASR